MRGLAIINAQTLKILERVILIFGMTTLGICVFLAGNAAYNFVQFNQANVQLKATKKDVQDLSSKLEHAKDIQLTPTVGKELSIVQAALDECAKANECQLLEATSASEDGSYLSRYDKTTDGKGWKQTVVQVQVMGPLANVLSMVKGVTLISVPIQIQTFEVAPSEKVDRGRPLVIAKFALQVMKQEARA